jgi:hypothetical protein
LPTRGSLSNLPVASEEEDRGSQPGQQIFIRPFIHSSVAVQPFVGLWQNFLVSEYMSNRFNSLDVINQPIGLYLYKEQHKRIYAH